MTRPTTRAIFAVALGAVLLAACKGDPAPPTVDCSTVTAPSYTALTIWPLCTSCHASTVSGAARQDAPGNVNFDTYAAAVAQAVQAAAQVNGGEMPPPDERQPTADEKAALYAWALCGTPN